MGILPLSPKGGLMKLNMYDLNVQKFFVVQVNKTTCLPEGSRYYIIALMPATKLYLTKICFHS